jgi:hypothetical protein
MSWGHKEGWDYFYVRPILMPFEVNDDKTELQEEHGIVDSPTCYIYIPYFLILFISLIISNQINDNSRLDWLSGSSN